MARFLIGDLEQFRTARKRLIGVVQERGGCRNYRGQRGLELMRQGIKQCRPQLLALSYCFNLRCQILCQRALEADGNQVADSLQDRVRHLRAL